MHVILLKFLFLFAVLSLSFNISYAQKYDYDLKICGGQEGGTYIRAAYWLARKLTPHFKSVSVVDSSGSLESHLKLAISDCDIGLAQGDALPYFEHKKSDLTEQFSKILNRSIPVSSLEDYRPVSLIDQLLDSGNGLYTEKVHLICNRELGSNFEYRTAGLIGTLGGSVRKGINSLPDLIAYLAMIRDNGSISYPKPTILLGPSGGGAHATFFAIKSTHPEFDQATFKAIDESNGLDNGVAAGLFEVFKQPTACFLYVSKVPHKIINMLDSMGSDSGPGNAVNQRIPTITIDGKAVSKFYFEGVKLLDSVSDDLLSMKDPMGVHLFAKTEISENYPHLRIADSFIDLGFTNFNDYFHVKSSPINVLATPTQIYATEQFNTYLNDNPDLEVHIENILGEAQRQRGHFPEPE